MDLMLPAADVGSLEKQSEESSPELTAAMASEDWLTTDGLPPAPNPWAGVRIWLAKPRWEDEPDELPPSAYFEGLLQCLKDPIPLKDLAAEMARLYLENEGISLGRRVSVLQALGEVVEAHLADLGEADLTTAICTVVGDRVPGWPPKEYEGGGLGQEFTLEILLGLFKEALEQKAETRALAHAIYQSIELWNAAEPGWWHPWPMTKTN